jgi:UDP-N-acetylglucosamine 2-epimerase (non-hydrolysing)
MIYFLIGTKAQLIKMFPLMRRLESLGIPYRYIDTVQHGPLCERIRAILNLPEPDHFLTTPGTQIESTTKAVAWAIGVVIRAISRRKTIFPEKGIVLVHGDTLSTLLGLLIGRLCGQQVCHVEAGERTHKLLSPFPEEIIRRIVDRYSDLLLACGPQQLENIRATGNANKAVNLGYSTLLDAVRAVAKTGTAINDQPQNRSVLVSIHRFETITSRNRMEFLVQAMEMLARTGQVIFGLHPPTRNKLEEFGLMGRLQEVPNLHLRDLLEYPDFIRTLRDSKFIVTDGGGPQEESYFFGVPCLLLRSETERAHPNVFMPDWNLSKVEWFSNNFTDYAQPPLALTSSPSREAVDIILKHIVCSTR